MKTKHKIALARLVWRMVRFGRRLGGRGMVGCYRRGGLLWNLDLDEGIDFSIYLLGAFELPTTRFYRKMIRPGDVVIDIGANMGAHTLPFARCVGPSGEVHAFEPTDFAYRKLVQNAALNPDVREIIVCNHTLLVGPHDSLIPEQIYSSWPMSPTVEVHPKLRGRLQPLAGANVDTLDSYCARLGTDRVDWVKIDVDGNETPVLLGARETMRKFRPKMIMEFSPYVCREAGYDFGELVDIVRGAGYELVNLETGHPLPADAGPLERLIPDGAGLNAFLRPVSGRGEEV